jgi:hypothetical protein
MKKTFTRKPNNVSNSRYSWSPLEYSGDNKKIKKDVVIVPCTATVGSQGYDLNVTYVYNNDHLAYVECNYVQ